MFYKCEYLFLFAHFPVEKEILYKYKAAKYYFCSLIFGAGAFLYFQFKLD